MACGAECLLLSSSNCAHRRSAAGSDDPRTTSSGIGVAIDYSTTTNSGCSFGASTVPSRTTRSATKIKFTDTTIRSCNLTTKAGAPFTVHQDNGLRCNGTHMPSILVWEFCNDSEGGMAVLWVQRSTGQRTHGLRTDQKNNKIRPSNEYLKPWPRYQRSQGTRWSKEHLMSKSFLCCFNPFRNAIEAQVSYRASQSRRRDCQQTQICLARLDMYCLDRCINAVCAEVTKHCQCAIRYLMTKITAC